MSTETQQAHFEGWAIIEMMGHQREIGFVTTQAFGQAVLFRVDTPEMPEREFVLKRPEWSADHGDMPAGSTVTRQAVAARSRLISPGALYAINPCTEEAAREALEHSVHRPLILIKRPDRNALVAAAEADILDPDDYEDNEEELELP